MASHTQLVTVSSDDSPPNEKKTQNLNAFTSPPTPSKHTAPLPSSPNPPSTPYGKTHAGEVHRRTDRQSDPLPAPGVGQSSLGNSTNRSSQSQRRLNGSGNGNYNGDSDSEDDRKQPRRYGGRDDDFELINRQKRPAPPSSSHAEASKPSPPEVYREEEERFHRSMQQTLALVGKFMTHYASSSMQQEQMANLIHSMPSDTRPGAMRSETYDTMLEYLEILREREIESNTTALMRQQITPSSEPEKENNWMRDEFSQMVRYGKITFRFVQLSQDPPYIMDLPGFHKRGRIFAPNVPTVLRVLVKENTPRFAEVVSRSLLADLGWWFSYETRTWCHNIVHRDKFSGRVIYQMEITGHITKTWEITDADRDSGFRAFEKIQREKKEREAEEQEAEEQRAEE